jgi:hypothetical protein
MGMIKNRLIRVGIILKWIPKKRTASVVYWSEFLATDPGIRVLFPALPESEKWLVWNAVHQPREYN